MIYKGERLGDRTKVTVDSFALDPRHDIRNHSPDGFEWGYHGSGPAQLALAILAHEYRDDEDDEDDEVALKYYTRFKDEVVANWRGSLWETDSFEVRKVIDRLEKELSTRGDTKPRRGSR